MAAAVTNKVLSNQQWIEFAKHNQNVTETGLAINKACLAAADRILPYTVLGLSGATLACSTVARTALAFFQGGLSWNIASAVFNDTVFATQVGIAVGLLITAASLRGNCVNSAKALEVLDINIKAALRTDDA